MTISTGQQVDYLWKKIGYGAAKTDIPTVLDATNEPFASPLQIRADKILQQSGSIPNVIPVSNTSVVSVYTTSAPVQCIADTGASTNRSWETGLSFWIPPEFGSTYQVKVYISPTGQPGNVLSKGTQIFATGSGNSDEWFFDYQAGILNFIGTNLPSVSFTGNSVYVSGAVYSGAFGFPVVPSLGNITIAGDVISTSDPSGNIFINSTGNGIVQVSGSSAVGIPYGNSIVRPSNPQIGFTRFNTDIGELESWNGNAWVTPNQATISSDVISPNGTSNVYTLSSSATTDGVLVSINGTLQQPYVSYTVSNNAITFSEVPLSTDSIEVRHIAVGAVSVSSVRYGVTQVVLDTANVNVTGNLLPSANVTYSVGSPTLEWTSGYFNTLNTSGAMVVGGNLTVLGTTTAVNTEIINQSEIIAGNLSAGNVNSNTFIGGTLNAVTIGNTGATLTGTLSTASQPNITTLAGLTNIGNGGSIAVSGNLNVSGDINFAGNVNQIQITGNSGQFFGNAQGFGALYAGIGTGYTIEPQTIIQLSANYNGYAQINLQNTNPGNVASSDIVATADNGNTNVGFIDLGINSSTYNQSGYGLTGPNDGYVYVVGNTGISSGNLVLSTYNSNADIIFSLGGGDTGNEIARFNNASKAFKVIGNVIATGYTNVGALYSPTIGNTGATLTGTIQTASQPNITALGTLGNLTITGNITAGNIIAGGVRQTTANVAPSNPTVGDQWYDTSTDILFKFTSDGTNYVWVDISSVALNTNVAIASYTQISASGNASVGTNLAVGNTLTVNSNGAPGAIINGGTSGVGNIGSSTGTFNIIFAKSTSSQYADLAEKYLADSDYEPGTVLVFGGSKEVTQSYKAYDTAVAGVVSTNPAHIMNDGIDGTAVALLGRVPCQVHGPINRGDLLVTSDTPGVAERLDETQWRPGCVIGKSLETMLENKTAIIEIVVGRI